MGFFKWIGRVCLWLIFWPVGLWRSIVHAKRKDQRRLEDAIVKSAAHVHPEPKVYIRGVQYDGLPPAPETADAEDV